MNPWTIDADDIQLAEDFDASMLFHVPGVDHFLKSSGNRLYVVGTKGIGKTLLLKAKRILTQESGVRCLPRNALIDKPIGDHVFGSDLIDLYSESTENWRKLWMLSITVTLMKELQLGDNIKVSPKLRSVLGAGHLRGVMDHFVNILSFSRKDLFRASNEMDSQIIPLVRNSIDTPVAVFLDSVDEHFDKHLLALSSTGVGELSPTIWHYSQLGLVEATYKLRRLNHHVKVFVSVRKEAFDRLNGITPMVQQYRGSSVDLTYTKENLRAIFEGNIRRERPKNLADKSQLGSDPLHAFCGRSSITHSFTGKSLDIFDYIYRHTFGRPRDLMTIGGEISNIHPDHRSETALKDAINECATNIAYEYVSEISPLMGDVNLDLVFTLIETNALSGKQLQSARRKYRSRVEKEDDRDPFTLLYHAGLIGIISQDHVRAARTQRFMRPGQCDFSSIGQLPESEYFLIHPALSELIKRHQSGYALGIDQVNVIGDGLRWYEPSGRRSMCVLKADIKNYSKIMGSPDEIAVLNSLKEALEENANSCDHVKVSGGDSFTIVDEDPIKVIRAARRIMERLYEAPSSPLLRIAIDRGDVEVSNENREPVTGLPFRTAARLEAIVDPGARGSIWVTESVKAAVDAEVLFYRLEPVSGDKINIKKANSNEPDEYVSVYRVV